MKYTAQELCEWENHFDAGTSGWLPARPDNWKFEGLLSRISNAWKVIIGDYDVVDWYNYRKTEKRTIAVVVPSELHRDTVNLVWQFSSAMAEKLRKSELKYGYDNKWKNKEWAAECRWQLQHHITKGDPLDVANYCAFLWHMKEKTNNKLQGKIMSNLKDEHLELGCNVVISANHWEFFPSEISISRESQYDNQDNIDVDISKEEAVEIVNFIIKHYKLEKQ